MTQRKNTFTGASRKASAGGGGAGAAPWVYAARYPLEFRLRVVEEVKRGEASLAQIGRVFGVAKMTLTRWVKRFEEGGAPALMPTAVPPAPAKGKTASAAAKRAAVVGARTEQPEWGTRRIRDVLRRFEALGVSETEVAHPARGGPDHCIASGSQARAPGAPLRAGAAQSALAD